MHAVKGAAALTFCLLVGSSTGLIAVPANSPTNDQHIDHAYEGEILGHAGAGMGPSALNYALTGTPWLSFLISSFDSPGVARLGLDPIVGWLDHQLRPGPNNLRMIQSNQPLLADGQFVWGPNAAGFDVASFLRSLNSPLSDYAGDIELWAGYTSVNPRVLLTVLEMNHSLVLGAEVDSEAQTLIEETAMNLATAFYDHLHTRGSRSPTSSEVFEGDAFLALEDGNITQIDSRMPSGTFALLSALGARSDLAEFQIQTDPGAKGGFHDVYGSMFPDSDPLATTNEINPTSLPPDNLLQFPFPVGATWQFGGPHSWNGDSRPPFSSLDFFLRGGTCSSPLFYYSTASAPGMAYHPSGYSCWIEISHGSGWTTSYYHLRNTFQGGSIDRNGVMGSIACELCAGGWSSGPHVHWSLKYNGAYVSLEGVKLTGWTVHVGPEAYTSGHIERGGIVLDPYEHVLNDFNPYYPQGSTSLRFYGTGTNDIDRVKIRVDDPANTNPGPPVDFGDTDFTLEWWMKAQPGDNGAPAITCGWNYRWIYGNTILDRDRYNQRRGWGVSMAAGRIAFGLTSSTGASYTLCGTGRVDDGAWHHIAIQRRRSDGYLWLYVDGSLQASDDGPDGDLSYPDNGVPANYCGPTGDQPCTNSDPFLVLGAEKHGVDNQLFPSFSGWLDELRASDKLRYTSNFARPTTNFTPDIDTLALYHFDEGAGTALSDVAGSPGGPGHGVLMIGGPQNGPRWSADTPSTPSDTLPPSLFIPFISVGSNSNP